MDRINGLSDDVNCHILSFLPFKEAVSTSVLSTRWRNLFAFRPTLHLDDHKFGEGQSFIDFVDRILDVSANIRTFSIKCRIMDYGNYSHITRWIIEVLKRGVLNLDIDVTFYEGAMRLRVPLEIFTCKTMVQLRLAKGFEFKIPEDVSLPSLKTLFLDSIWFYGSRYRVLEKFLSVCPALEELTISGDRRWIFGNGLLTVSSSTLKKLTLLFLFPCTERLDWGITLNTPRLTYLEYSDVVPKDYSIVNLESLVEAKLKLRSCRHGISNPTNLIKGLLNVEILELSSVVTTEIFWKFREAIPVFSNLFRLSIVTRYSYLGLLPILLENSPNLHTLVIKGRLYFDSYEQEYGLSSPVKVLKITEFGGRTVELEQMKVFLEKLSSLELVKVRAYATSDKEKSQITKDLLMLPRSSNCNIRIKFCEETK